ncbi:MAG: hypothetical protein ACYDAC_04340 [Candidatus Dormibacteria bacterium]
MVDETVTIALGGEVQLDDLVTAVSHFSGLLEALRSAVAAGTVIDWIVSDLRPGSAEATVTGRVVDEAAPRLLRVVRAYEDVGRALEHSDAVPFSPSVAKEARGILSVLNGRIDSVRFETAEREAIIRSPLVAAKVVEVTEAAYGAVEGKVQTVSNRGGLHFTLYDRLNDKAVSCYLAPGYEAIMLDVWGKTAVVEGFVRRDPTTGRPVTIRGVRSIDVIRTGDDPDAYLAARASVRRSDGLRAEEIIRRLRDA